MMRFTSQGLVFSLAFISPILAHFKKNVFISFF